MTKEPEQMLEQDRAATGVIEFFTHGRDRRHEKARSNGHIKRHHYSADKQGRKRQQAKNRGHEYAPQRQRQAHHGHAACTRLENGRYIVQAAHGESDDEEGE